MRPIRLVVYLIIIAALLPLTASAQRSLNYTDVGQSDSVPSPRILQPYLDTYDLTGKSQLVFKWSPHEGNQTQRDHYDFRLYKGAQALGPARIYKTRTPPRQWSLALDAGMFEDGQVYTCVLRQVYTGSIRSWPSYQTFKVIKKNFQDNLKK